LEIGDVSEELALKYLKSGGMPESVAKTVYDVVGGRLLHLKQALDCFHPNNPNSGAGLSSFS
jgi:hypothetical protein